MLTRRTALALFGAALVTATRPSQAAPLASSLNDMLDAEISAMEQAIGGKLGIAAVDTATGITFARRGDDRFPMTSTFKFLLAGAVLARVDSGQEQLDREIFVRPEDLLDYAPVVETFVGQSMTVAQLCEATLTLSDNSAANILLATMGGPEGLTTFIATLGDDTTRLDRTEPTLNEGAPGDPRDTTTPVAMLGSMQRLLMGDALTPASRDRLTAWLVANQTGDARIRAGAPAGWTVGDKTGTGGNGTVNDIAILLPPDRAPLLLTIYVTQTAATVGEVSAVHAAVTRLVTDAL